MLNSDFVNQQAKKLAVLAQKESPDDRQQVKLILARVMQRTPTDEEISRGIEFIDDRKKEFEDEPNKPLELFCVIALNLNEFLFLD